MLLRVLGDSKILMMVDSNKPFVAANSSHSLNQKFYEKQVCSVFAIGVYVLLATLLLT